VKSRASGIVECQDRLKPSEVGELRVMWTYRIGWDLLPTSRSCHGNQRGKRKEEGEVESPWSPCMGVAVATIGGGGKRRVKWKVPGRHAVAAHWPNIPDSLV
jgi:hypothetical protein